jgi:CheY-like chemotaxis protein
MSESRETFEARGRVLLADDEPIVASSAEAILEDFGFEVLTVEDGQLAVEAFESDIDGFCLVLLDITMPRMSGLEACRHILQLRPKTPVILSSGYNEQDIAGEFEGDPSVRFISKPYRISQLEEMLRAIFSTR